MFNTLAASAFNARLARANLVTETDFDDEVSILDNKIAVNKTKNQKSLLKMNLKRTFDSSRFRDINHFEQDGMQNYLVYQSINGYFKVIGSIDYSSLWKSRGLSAETIKPPATSDNSLTPA